MQKRLTSTDLPNLRRLRTFDKSEIKERRVRLYAALTKANLRFLLSSRTTDPIRVRKHIKDSYIRWAMHNIPNDPSHYPIRTYIRNYYPFVGEEGLRLLDRDLHDELKAGKQLRYVPRECEIAALMEEVPQRKKILMRFRKRSGMNDSWQISEPGAGVYVSRSATLDAIKQFDIITGGLADEYHYGIQLVLRQAASKGYDLHTAIERYASSIRRCMSFGHIEVGTKGHEKVFRGWRPPFVKRSGSTHSRWYLHRDDEIITLIEEAQERYYQDLEQAGQHPRTPLEEDGGVRGT